MYSAPVTPEHPKFSPEFSFPDAVSHVVELAAVHQVDLCFVGGAVSDPVRAASEIQFDIPNHTIILKGSPTSLKRPDGTIKDLDAIAFCPDQNRYTRFCEELTALESRHRHRLFPQASIEPVVYDTWAKSKLRLPQFVSTIEFRGDQPFFCFGNIRQRVSPDSLNRWTIELSEHSVSYPAFHPFANFLRHCMRNASGIKEKDRGTKITGLLAFASLTMREENAIDPTADDRNRNLFSAWGAFIDQLLTCNDMEVRLKRDITRWYWKTIGTTLAHGKGPINLTSLSNKFTG